MAGARVVASRVAGGDVVMVRGWRGLGQAQADSRTGLAGCVRWRRGSQPVTTRGWRELGRARGASGGVHGWRGHASVWTPSLSS
jgi:hypothetical protein